MMKNLIYFVITLQLTSCSVVHKFFNKKVIRTDSVSVLHEKKDSSVLNSQTAIHKDSSAQENSIVIDWSDSSKPIFYYDTSSKLEFFSINQLTGEIKASKVPVKVTIRGTKNTFNFDSLYNHSEIQLSDIKSDSGHVIKSEKEVTKKVDKTKVPVWQFFLLGFLILGAVWVWKNRKKVWAVIVHFFTGL